MNMHENKQETWFYYRGPHLPHLEQIAHYYGDLVRILFIASAIIMLFAAPWYTDALETQMPLIVIGAVALVATAALLSPRSVMAVRISAVLSGVIAVVYEMWALWGYEGGSAIDFVLREVPALLCMFAFYYSLKTLRAMLTGMVGKNAADFDLERKRREDAAREEDVALDGLGHPAAITDDMGDM